MIELEGLSKTFRVAKRAQGLGAAAKSLFRREYREVRALDGVSLRIGAGEIVGYIGPNGAGKSTSIKVMSGILVPDAGRCEVMGYVPWAKRRQYVRHIGVVFGQRTQLWWDVPVIDSFELLRGIYRIPPDDYRRTLGRLTERLDLGGLLHTPLRQLSLGQRMRCEIAASLLHSPSVLFLDEPTIGLDAVSKLAVRDFIRDINAETGVTVLLTTHDMNDIEALTDRVALIGRGRLLYDGSMRAIRGEMDAGRRLTVRYDAAGGARPAVPDGAKLLSAEEGVMELDLPSGDAIPAALAAIGSAAAILDVTAASRPIEEIVAALYGRYGL